jgi:hypothetical protein
MPDTLLRPWETVDKETYTYHLFRDCLSWKEIIHRNKKEYITQNVKGDKLSENDRADK